MSLPDRMTIGRSAESSRVSSAAPMRRTCASTLRIGEFAPPPSRIALREVRCVPARSLAQCSSGSLNLPSDRRRAAAGANMNGAVGAAIEHGGLAPKPHGAQRRGARSRFRGWHPAFHCHSVSPRHLRRRAFPETSFRRAFASSSACAIARHQRFHGEAAVPDRISAMRGSTCVTAKLVSGGVAGDALAPVRDLWRNLCRHRRDKCVRPMAWPSSAE